MIEQLLSKHHKYINVNKFAQDFKLYNEKFKIVKYLLENVLIQLC